MLPNNSVFEFMIYMSAKCRKNRFKTYRVTPPFNEKFIYGNALKLKKKPVVTVLCSAYTREQEIYFGINVLNVI